MKSIMEEASSISKAVEKGWIRAGKPQEFTVKVFEEPQKNFIGLTTKPAKIGLFFEPSSVKTVESRDKKIDIKTNRPQRSLKDEVAHEFQKSTARQEKPQQKRFNPQDKFPPIRSFEKSSEGIERSDKNVKKLKPQNSDFSTKKEQAPFTSPWSTELTESAKDWIKQSLQLMHINQSNFNAEVDRYALRITFTNPLTENSEKEKMLFRSWAYLVMQALRQKYKRPLKGLKIILMSNT